MGSHEHGRCCISIELFGAILQHQSDTGLGCTLAAPVRVEPYGSIANLLDPDGYAVDLCAYR